MVAGSLLTNTDMVIVLPYPTTLAITRAGEKLSYTELNAMLTVSYVGDTVPSLPRLLVPPYKYNPREAVDEEAFGPAKIIYPRWS